MAGSIGYFLKVVHIFQRRFNSESLTKALTDSHLYLISRRPSVRIDRGSVRAYRNRMVFDIVTRSSVRSSKESHSLTLSLEAGQEIEDFRTYSNSSYFSFRLNGLLVHGDAWALSSLASNASPDLAAQEVLYVGKAYGRDGSGNVGQRTSHHSTLQKIYEDHSAEDWDIFISPIEINRIEQLGIDHIDDNEPGTTHILGIGKDDPFFNGWRSEMPPTSIDLIEHALIYYFAASYNELLRDWRPGRPTAALTRFKSAGFRLLIVYLDGWHGLARYYSAEAAQARSHLVLLAADDKPGRENPRVNYDPATHNWLFEFAFARHKEHLSASETSDVVMAIFGQEAPRMRRPREALLLDQPTWSLEKAKGDWEKLIKKTTRYAGPGYDPITGLIPIGENAKGATLHWRLVRPGQGVCHGIIAGPRGTGKTNALQIVRIEAYASCLFDVITIDPTGRHDSALWREYADSVALTLGSGIEMLSSIASEVAARREAGNYSLSPSNRGILVTLEDAHLIFGSSNTATEAADVIAELGESCGISLVVTVPDLNVARFGDRHSLRTALGKFNTAVFGGPDVYEMLAEGDEHA